MRGACKNCGYCNMHSEDCPLVYLALKIPKVLKELRQIAHNKPLSYETVENAFFRAMVEVGASV